MTRRRRPARTAEELREEMIQRIGWAAAQSLIESEADTLHVDDDSPSAIRSAYVTFQLTHTTTPTLQERLLP